MRKSKRSNPCHADFSPEKRVAASAASALPKLQAIAATEIAANAKHARRLIWWIMSTPLPRLDRQRLSKEHPQLHTPQLTPVGVNRRTESEKIELQSGDHRTLAFGGSGKA